MEKLTIRQYATRYKLSTFNVVKMTRSGELKTETIQEDGRESILILVDEADESAVEKKLEESQRAPRGLRAENMLLKKEIARLKEQLARCKRNIDTK